MIGFYTNNAISRSVMLALNDAGMNVKHIADFEKHPIEPSIFYGILRGSGIAMRVMDHLQIDYWYIDNGYFDALYIDESMHKYMTGKFRLVKNDTVELFANPRPISVPGHSHRIALIIPPSPYSAHHYSTTPEDWTAYVKHMLKQRDYNPVVRGKDSKQSLEYQLVDASIVISMHSMVCMKAAELSIPSYDTHGIYRNFHELEKADFSPKLYATIQQLKEFYEPKQYTLDEIRAGKVSWK